MTVPCHCVSPQPGSKSLLILELFFHLDIERRGYRQRVGLVGLQGVGAHGCILYLQGRAQPEPWEELEDLSRGLTAHHAVRNGRARENHIYSPFSFNPELPTSETANPEGTLSFTTRCIYFYKAAACSSGASLDLVHGIHSWPVTVWWQNFTLQPPKSLGFIPPFHTAACTLLEQTQADVHFPCPSPVRVVWRGRRAGSGHVPVHLPAQRLLVPPAKNNHISALVLMGKKLNTVSRFSLFVFS